MLNAFALAPRFAMLCLLTLLVMDAPRAKADAAAPVKQATIEIKDLVFAPKVLTIAPGTEVVWINHDSDPHTVVSTADPKVLMSPVLDTTERFSFVFKDPGSFAYYCSVHPHMQGTVIVK